MKTLALISIFIFQVPAFASELESRICGKNYSKSEIVKSWSIEKQLSYCHFTHCNYDEFSKVKEILNKQVGEKYCATANCYIENKKTETTLCFLQSDSNKFTYFVQKNAVNAESKLETEFLTHSFSMSEKDHCYRDCRPVQNKIIPLSFLDKAGLNRESCQKCFMDREYSITNEIKYITSPEVGNQKLYKGQLCYKLCVDPENEYLVKSPISTQCKECVGQNEKSEKIDFQYILTKDGSCYEYRENKLLGIVENAVCTHKNPGRTHYEKDYKLTLGILFGTEKYPCMELDNLTGGNLLKSYVEENLCDQEKNTNNTNRNSFKIKDNLPETINSTKTTEK